MHELRRGRAPPRRRATATPAWSPATTYRYRVRAADAAGNLSPYSNVATATTPAVPDTSPPTAPTGLTATPGGSSQINLEWTAVDRQRGRGGLSGGALPGCGLHELRPGGDADDHQPTATPAWLPSTTYRYRVRAVDPSGNLSGYSNVATATTPATPPTPPGLVGGLGIQRGSRHDHRRRLGQRQHRDHHRRATWTQGRYGSALSFNGINSLVRWPALGLTEPHLGHDAGSLGPAHRRPERLADHRAAAGRCLLPPRQQRRAAAPRAAAAPWAAPRQYASGPTASPVNAWTHVAAHLRRQTLRLYVNGTQVASQAATGPIQTTTNPLWIGGNSYGEYFQGLIDEVRIYNRALTPAEIQTDMAAPIAP